MTQNAFLSRRPVRYFPPIGLSLLFRPLPKASQRPALDVAFELTPGHCLRFSAREALGVPEQTLLLAVLELAGEQFSDLGEGALVAAADRRPLPGRLWTALYPDGGLGLPQAVMLKTSWEELNRRCNAGNGGSIIAMRRASLRRLCEVVVWEEHSHSRTSRQSFLMVWMEGDDRKIHLALNHRLASVFLGGQYAKVWMSERLSLGSDLAMHIHAFLSSCIRPGNRLRIGSETLANRIWSDGRGKAPAGTVRRRMSVLRQAVESIGRLPHWKVTWEPGHGLMTVERLEGGGVRNMTSMGSASSAASFQEQVPGEKSNKDRDLSRYDVCGLFT